MAPSTLPLNHEWLNYMYWLLTTCRIHSTVTKVDVPGDNPVGIIAGSAVAVVVCMIIVIIMVIIFLRR